MDVGAVSVDDGDGGGFSVDVCEVLDPGGVSMVR